MKMEKGFGSFTLKHWNGAKSYIFMISIQCGIATLTIIAMFALNQGMSTYTFVVYRHALAAFVIAPFAFVFERHASPRITRSIFLKLMVLGLLEPVLDQNLYNQGMRITSATYTATISNLLPAITFLFAWILRLEKVNLKELGSISKVLGTMVSVSGAMAMTLYKGPVLGKGSLRLNSHGSNGGATHVDIVKGSIFLMVSCCCWAGYMILQAITIKEYPSELSLATWICIMGATEGTVVALVMEQGQLAAWSIGWNSKLLAIVFAGVVCSGMAYCFQGAAMKEKGPVFVTSFSPLSMILVAACGMLLLGEDLFLGGVMGSVLIVLGLYMVVWGKSRDPQPVKKEEAVELAIDA